MKGFRLCWVEKRRNPLMGVAVDLDGRATVGSC
jgi:hypothetical protein